MRQSYGYVIGSTYVKVAGGFYYVCAITFRTCPKGCGCLQYAPEQIRSASALGVRVKFKVAENGHWTDIAALKSRKATFTSQTGVRGVSPEKKRGTYRTAVQVAGELLVRTGFASVESAKAAYDEMKQELIAKHGLEKGHAETTDALNVDPHEPI